MIKYEYETGMCKQLHYNGLWSVQYEGVPKHFTILITFVSDAGTDHLYFFKMSGNGI